jgi:hypothetical protein
MPTDPQQPNPSAPVPVTVVIVENGGRPSEPYLGRPPEGDQCVVFAQHPEESAFVLDLRLRECMADLTDRGHRIQEAVLVWDQLDATRELSRRARLVARRISPGGTLFICSRHPKSAQISNSSYRPFTESLTAQLKQLGVELCFFNGDPSQAPAPLRAAWKRLAPVESALSTDEKLDTLEADARRIPKPHKARRRDALTQSGVLPRELVDAANAIQKRRHRSR